MPFGLRNASQAFQRHIDQVLDDMTGVVAYVDDVIIGSPDVITHKKDLCKLFNLLHNANLQINLKNVNSSNQKYSFLATSSQPMGSDIFHRVWIQSECFPNPRRQTSSEVSWASLITVIDLYQTYQPYSLH